MAVIPSENISIIGKENWNNDLEFPGRPQQVIVYEFTATGDANDEFVVGESVKHAALVNNSYTVTIKTGAGGTLNSINVAGATIGDVLIIVSLHTMTNFSENLSS